MQPNRQTGARVRPASCSARPFTMPTEDKAPKEYRIEHIVCSILLTIVCLSVIWGYAVVYQWGYEAAITYYTQVAQNGR